MSDPISELECTVVEARMREPGFYQTEARIFYVSPRQGVYLLMAPGAPLILHQEDDLPDAATSIAAEAVDAPRRHLAAVIDRYGGRLVGLKGRRHEA